MKYKPLLCSQGYTAVAVIVIENSDRLQLDNKYCLYSLTEIQNPNKTLSHN